MYRIQQSAVVPYTPAQMFDLVNAISDYPDFLPWCRAGRITAEQENTVEATLDIAWAGIKKSFSTRNTLSSPERIDINLAKGPFRYLKGGWHFVPDGQTACKVSLALEFELSGNFLDKLFQPVFLMIANSMVDAFSKRARTIYGNNDG